MSAKFHCMLVGLYCSDAERPQTCILHCIVWASMVCPMYVPECQRDADAISIVVQNLVEIDAV